MGTVRTHGICGRLLWGVITGVTGQRHDVLFVDVQNGLVLSVTKIAPADARARGRRGGLCVAVGFRNTVKGDRWGPERNRGLCPEAQPFVCRAGQLRTLRAGQAHRTLFHSNCQPQKSNIAFGHHAKSLFPTKIQCFQSISGLMAYLTKSGNLFQKTAPAPFFWVPKFFYTLKSCSR